jgi:hypothetical protein
MCTLRVCLRGTHLLAIFILCSIYQYLRQNRSTCKGFCRFIELLSAITTTQSVQEALYGHFSMFAMPPTHRHEGHVASIQPHCYSDGGHDGACHDVGPVPVGREYRKFKRHFPAAGGWQCDRQAAGRLTRRSCPAPDDGQHALHAKGRQQAV